MVTWLFGGSRPQWLVEAGGTPWKINGWKPKMEVEVDGR